MDGAVQAGLTGLGIFPVNCLEVSFVESGDWPQFLVATHRSPYQVVWPELRSPLSAFLPAG